MTAAMRTIPVTVIGGYLGAGKTSTLNGLLSAADGPRLGVLVNDFGAVSIDEKLIVSRDGDIVTLANGCACCSVAGDLGEALDRLARIKPSFEHIVIEASGVADPARIAALAHAPGLDPRAPVVLVDAETIVARSHDKFVGRLVRRQISQAGLILLNKIDLADARGVAAARTLLEAEAPCVRIVETENGRVAAAVILAGGDRAPSRFACDRADEDMSTAFESHVWSSDEALSLSALRDALQRLPRGVARIKGLARASDGRTYEIQRDDRRLDIRPLASASCVARRSDLVCIALAGKLDRAALDRTLNGCIIRGPDGT
jgi:G3E family GTPase